MSLGPDGFVILFLEYSYSFYLQEIHASLTFDPV